MDSAQLDKGRLRCLTHKGTTKFCKQVIG
jgi:hypothetical protein